jgi:hypothetical protein
MITVHKYTLPFKPGMHVIHDSFQNAQVRSFNLQEGNLVVWAEVNTEMPRDKITVVLLETGKPLSISMHMTTNFVGTMQFEQPGANYYVVHLFQLL